MAKPQKIRGVDRASEYPFDTSSTSITFVEGDLCYLAGSGLLPMGSVTITTAFAGVAAQNKPAANNIVYGNSTIGVIRVDNDGEYEFDCDDTVALVPGDFMGPSSTTKVAKVGSETISVGRVVKATTPGSGGRVRIKIQSAVLPAAKTT